ncbi:MAG: HIT domain-containing protein [Acidimicrobiales bacterium]
MIATEAPSDCVFCAIVGGTAPAEVVGETDTVVAFRDIAPVAPTHVLVVPRRHIDDAATLGPQDGVVVASMFALAKAVAERDEVLQSGYRLVLNVGRHAQNSVGHLHLHVLGGRQMTWPPG